MFQIFPFEAFWLRSRLKKDPFRTNPYANKDKKVFLFQLYATVRGYKNSKSRDKSEQREDAVISS
jgi:hypothetical protein